MNGPLPISYSDIESYCHLRGIYSLTERERLLKFLDLLDQKWMGDFYEKQEAEMNKRSKQSGKSSKTPPNEVPREGRRPPRKPVT